MQHTCCLSVCLYIYNIAAKKNASKILLFSETYVFTSEHFNHCNIHFIFHFNLTTATKHLRICVTDGYQFSTDVTQQGVLSYMWQLSVSSEEIFIAFSPHSYGAIIIADAHRTVIVAPHGMFDWPRWDWIQAK